MVQRFIALAVGADVAAGEALFKVLEEGGVNGHDVFKVAVLGAVLDHEDLAVALDNLRLDLADLLVQQNFVGQLSDKNLLADFGNALGAKRVSGARSTELPRRTFLPKIVPAASIPSSRNRWKSAARSWKKKPRASRPPLRILRSS